MPVEAENASKPAEFLVLVAFYQQVAGHCMLFFLLSEGEIWQWKEILVKRHIVVDILVACHSGEQEFLVLPFNCQSVEKGIAAVETRVVVVDFTGAYKFVGVSALAHYRHACRIQHCQSFFRNPFQFKRCPHGILFVAFLTVICIGEESVGMCVVDTGSYPKIVG